MKAKFALLAAALAATAAAAPAYADDNGTSVSDLAAYTGLTERKVRMVLGDRSAFPEYRITYDRTLAHFKRALGNSRYEQLIAGQPIKLESQGEVRVALVDR